MRDNLAYILVALSLTFFACQKMQVGVNTYDIEYSESITFDQNKKLIFVDVISDSRCPVNVDCVWPGEATIALQAICTPGDTINFELSFGEIGTDHRDTTIFDIYRVELLEVLPLTEEGVELEKEDYSIRVLVEKS
ncbi:MAG: hypothetical protein DRI69_08215 [Bacteroidetes bacterium]|nr:MAG: hypothetical protein DRI69_08215 [Bacteroidota bacterium]